MCVLGMDFARQKTGELVSVRLLFFLVFYTGLLAAAPKRCLVVGNTRQGDRIENPYHRQMWEPNPKWLDFSYLEKARKAFPGFKFCTLDLDPLSEDFLKTLPKGVSAPHIQTDFLSFDSNVQSKQPFDMIISEGLFPKATTFSFERIGLEDVPKAACRNLKVGGSFIMDFPLELSFYSANRVEDAEMMQRTSGQYAQTACLPLLGTGKQQESFFGRCMGFALDNLDEWNVGLKKEFCVAICEEGFVRNIISSITPMTALCRVASQVPEAPKGEFHILETGDIFYNCIVDAMGPDFHVTDEVARAWSCGYVSSAGSLKSLVDTLRVSYNGFLDKLWKEACFYQKAVSENVSEIATLLGCKRSKVLGDLRREARSQITRQAPCIEQSLGFVFLYHQLFKDRTPAIIESVQSTGFRDVSLNLERGPNKHNGRHNTWILRAIKKPHVSARAV